MVIEKRQWLLRGERCEPQRQTRQLNGGWIQVDAVKTALRDEPAETRAVGVVEVGAAAAAFANQRAFVTSREKPACRHEKCGAAHRGIDEPQPENFLR